MSRTGLVLSKLVGDRLGLFPVSGEINRVLANPEAAIERLRQHYMPLHPGVDYTDGLSMEFEQWRFNIRCSNTEPVVRLNVEARGDETLMRVKTEELLRRIDETVK
jgi:phosphomannomutase/phosphomannomutase/phosphoglucomutase